MQTDMIKIAPGLQTQIEAEAREMDNTDQRERQFAISDTSVKLWLVKVGTPEAEKRMSDKGSVLSGPINIGGSQFFLARR